MEIGILVSIALVVVILFATSSSPRRRRTPYYYDGKKPKQPDPPPKQTLLLEAGSGNAPAQSVAGQEPEKEAAFSDQFDVQMDTRSWDFYSDHRRKQDLVVVQDEIRKAGIEVAIAKRMNELDVQINGLNLTYQTFDLKQQKAVLELMQEKQAILEESLKVRTGEARVALERQLLEVNKAQFEHGKAMLLDHFERENWKIEAKVQQFEIAKYFHQKYQTLEVQKINLAHQRDQLALQRDRDNISNLFAKLDVREARAKIREDVSQLVVRENRLTLRTDEYDFLQRRAVKHIGFDSLETYMDVWKKMNNLARNNGFSSVENCVYSLLNGGQLASLLETKREFEQLRFRYNQLQAATTAPPPGN